MYTIVYMHAYLHACVVIEFLHDAIVRIPLDSSVALITDQQVQVTYLQAAWTYHVINSVFCDNHMQASRIQHEKY